MLPRINTAALFALLSFPSLHLASGQTKYLPVLINPVADSTVSVGAASWSFDVSPHFSMEAIDDNVVRVTSNQLDTSGNPYLIRNKHLAP